MSSFNGDRISVWEDNKKLEMDVVEKTHENSHDDCKGQNTALHLAPPFSGLSQSSHTFFHDIPEGDRDFPFKAEHSAVPSLKILVHCKPLLQPLFTVKSCFSG